MKELSGKGENNNSKPHCLLIRLNGQNRAEEAAFYVNALSVLDVCFSPCKFVTLDKCVAIRSIIWFRASISTKFALISDSTDCYISSNISCIIYRLVHQTTQNRLANICQV
jgi:hypothetical protein